MTFVDAVDQASRLKDCPKMFECDDSTGDKVRLGSNRVFHFGMKDIMEQLKVTFGSQTLDSTKSFNKSIPRMNEGLRW